MRHSLAAMHESVQWAIATEIHVAWHAGDQDSCGLVVLNVSFVAPDPKRSCANRTRSGLVFERRITMCTGY